MGILCDECEDGYWNMDGASGCQPCSCDSANSLSYVCDKASAREARQLYYQISQLSWCRFQSINEPMLWGGVMKDVAMCSGDGTVPVSLGVWRPTV